MIASEKSDTILSDLKPLVLTEKQKQCLNIIFIFYFLNYSASTTFKSHQATKRNVMDGNQVGTAMKLRVKLSSLFSIIVQKSWAVCMFFANLSGWR